MKPDVAIEELQRRLAVAEAALIELARTEAALRESEDRFQTLFSSSPVPFMVLAPNTPDFTITAANDAYLAATLTTREGLVGRRLFDVFTDDPTRSGQLGSEALGVSLHRVLASKRPDVMARTRYDIVVRGGGFEPHWWQAINAPVLDASGQVTAIIHQVTRVTELHRAEMAAQEFQERQAFLLQLSDTLRPLADPMEVQNAAMKLLAGHLGVMRATYFEVDDDQDGFRLTARYERSPAPIPERMRLSDFAPDLADTYRAGGVVSVRDTEAAPTKAERSAYREIGVRAWMAISLAKEGRLVSIVGVQSTVPRDWTPAEVRLLEELADRTWAAVERARAEAALRESEEQQRLTLTLLPAMLWWTDATGGRMLANESWKSRTGQVAGQVDEFGWLNAIHPDDAAETRAAFEHAFATGQPLERQQRILQAGDGVYRWHLIRHVPVHDDKGTVKRWFCVAFDVDEQHRLQDRQQVLLHELQHRVRNTLAVVRSIAANTGQTSETVEDFAAHLEGRLGALARTQMVLTRAPGEGVDLESMVREELLAQAAREGQLELTGADVRLSPKAAEVFTLLVHELATNAVKYGALAQPGGRISIAWKTRERDGLPWLRLVWEESGVRVATTAPRREGFGMELIQQRVPYELRGNGVLLFRPGGVRCEIEFPLNPRESILQSDAPFSRPG